MAAIFQTTFPNAFSLLKIYKFRLRFHWNLLGRVQLTIFLTLPTHICVTRLSELIKDFASYLQVRFFLSITLAEKYLIPLLAILFQEHTTVYCYSLGTWATWHPLVTRIIQNHFVITSIGITQAVFTRLQNGQVSNQRVGFLKNPPLRFFPFFLIIKTQVPYWVLDKCRRR